MKKYYIKRISIILSVLMILSSFPMLSASAYEYVSPDNVTYLDASFATAGVEDWYAWTWTDNSNGRWVKGDEVSLGVYSFNYLDGNVLFARLDKTKTPDWNNGSVYNQTEDLTNHTADYFYVITAWKSDTSNKMQGKWEFVGPDKPPTDETVTVEPPTTEPFTTQPSSTAESTSATTDPTQPSTGNARDSLYFTIQNIRNNMPVGGTPYTTESYKRFSEALKRAENLLQDSDVADEIIRQAEQELIEAYDNLEYSTADRTKLWAAIDMLRPVIESEQYKSLPNGDTLKEDYDYALPVVYYEPEQSVIDQWEAKILADLKAAGVITEPTTDTTEPTTESYPTIPSSEAPTGYTEPTAATEDPTSHCTEHDLPYSPDFAVALANYSNTLVGSALTYSDIDIFYVDTTTVVFGFSDNLCTVGEEDIDGYHFENWNFFPREANKTGYCVYFNGTICNLPDAVESNIMSARALASVIPHSYKIDNSTTVTNPAGTVPSRPTEPTATGDTMPTAVTEPYETADTNSTEPTTYPATAPTDGTYGTYPATEDPTGHCTDWEQEQLKMQFATELVKYSYELGFSEPLSVDNVYSYTEDYKNYIFALKFNYDTGSTEIINGYLFVNYGFVPNNSTNKTGLCVFDGTKIYDLPAAVKLGIVSAPTLAGVIPYTEKIIDEQFVTKLIEYTQALGLNEYAQALGFKPYTENDILNSRYPIIDFYGYSNAAKSWIIFGIKDTLCTDGIEVIGDYRFCNKSFYGRQYSGEKTNLTGYCVYYNGEVHSIAEAVEKDIVSVEYLADVLPNTTKVSSTEATEPTTDPEPLWMTAMRAFKVYLGSLYDGYYDVSKTTYLGEIGEDCELLYGWGYEEPVSGGYIQIGSYKIWAPATTPFQSAGLFIYKNGEIKLLKDAYADGDVTDVERIISLINAADKSLGFEITEITQTDNTEPDSTQSATTETVPAVKYDIRNAKFSPISAKTYMGKAITPTIKVMYNGKILSKNKDYTLSYKNNKNVGTATITVTGKGSYTGKKSVTFKIVKAANPMTVKATVKSVKYTNLKKSKQTVSAITVTKAIGKMSYTKSSGSKYLTIASNGKITVKKGTKKGTYSIKVKVTAAGNPNYKNASKTVSVTIKVK